MNQTFWLLSLNLKLTAVHGRGLKQMRVLHCWLSLNLILTSQEIFFIRSYLALLWKKHNKLPWTDCYHFAGFSGYVWGAGQAQTTAHPSRVGTPSLPTLISTRAPCLHVLCTWAALWLLITKLPYISVILSEDHDSYFLSIYLYGGPEMASRHHGTKYGTLWRPLVDDFPEILDLRFLYSLNLKIKIKKVEIGHELA